MPFDPATGERGLVSVVLPVYNGGPYLALALNSMLAQDYEHMEVIAIDDGSTDGSLRTLREAAAADPRVRIVSRENRGLIATLNESLEMCRGEFVARMDADDISYPDRLSDQVRMLREHPRMALCGARFDMLELDRFLRPGEVHSDDPEDLAVMFRFFTVLIHSAVMFNRNLLGAELRYSTEYPHVEDLELFSRIAERHQVGLVPRRLVAYRLHGGSVSDRNRLLQRCNHARVVARNLTRAGIVADATALDTLGQARTDEDIDRLAALFREIDASAERVPPSRRPAYERGLARLFFVTMQYLQGSVHPRLAERFIARSGLWRMLRRRERWLLRAAAPVPAIYRSCMAGLNWLEQCQYYAQCRRKLSSVPGYGDMVSRRPRSEEVGAASP